MPPHSPLRHVARIGLLAVAALVAACSTPRPIPVVEKPLPPERQIPVGVAALLTERFPDLHVVANSSGPLLKPEINDIAVVLAHDESASDYVIALLEPGEHADYRLVGASMPITPGCAQCSVGVDLGRHGLYVHVIRAVNEEFENFTYQFAYRDGADALTMVGVTAYVPPRADDPIPHSFSASVDLLNGRRTDIVDEAQNDDTSHRERQTLLPVRPPISFDTFTFTADALEAETRKLPPAVFDPAGTLPAAAVDVLRERFPRMTVQSQASGSLRGDGLRDIVVVLVPADRSARSGAATDAIVAVMLGQPDGSVKLADVSAPMAHDCPTCDAQVQIARRTLTVQTTEVNSTGSQSVAWQFASRSRDLPLRLVAVRDEASVRSVDGDKRRKVSNTNLLSGERVELSDDVVHGRKNRSEQKVRVAPRSPIALAAFGFDPSVLDDVPTEIARDAKAEPVAAAVKLSGS
ncbi:MAG: hypothetical protein ABIR54_23780 [Burkholderiaceae bacterium]